MKQILFTSLVLFAIGITSCRKSSSDLDIKQYDNQQIQNYISANGLSGMERDTTGGDTTGIYYKIIDQGKGAALNYTDAVSYVYKLNTFDGKYTVQDTVLNHAYGVLGHVVPPGLQLAIHNLLKYKGGKMRVLIPSHLGYGLAGAGSGSSTVTNGRIAGNQCLDYTIYVVYDQNKYDDLVIQNYMTANSLTGYTKVTEGPDSGLYYKITTVGTGAQVNINSTVQANYVAKLMNNTVFDDHSSITASFSDLGGGSITKGFADGMLLTKSGDGGISMLIPSRLAYSTSGITNSIPVNACLRFDVTNITITQ
ncbi:FKBP-type peptidyl-prolyl cis-trans isomerase [Mucilaginibacter sp.]|jgi:FKBP-type peptidyl-prolyl cis-trans isomerase|uniref:FKBP-type peptidyl-prolyl cis-trans isomerase n=1 Tax=Mucilaginibacter sp. TaxID=1882438 RepID=UPI002BE96283|nr:FKBP-type peptidyl-prolyl cis-trans isomerase [Mucilaginibacter sp.]HTI59836.1 FKBP-type peptidyl-prolyl cis-trans isomerase [Mucilaginibacter sp.]